MTLLERRFPGWHPVVQMAEVANDPEAEPRMRFDACKEVARYVTPALKAIELTGANGGEVNFKVLVVPHTE